MRYWWVNHKKTSKFEIAGGFLWSPMKKANGSRNHFYDNMREASPGDAVISFSHAKIGYVGLVTEFATPSPIPPLFKNAGENWDKNSGWLLSVRWDQLSIPITPKDRINEFGNRLPRKYSPIDPVSGRGRENAYLAEVSQEVFQLLIGEYQFTSSFDELPKATGLSVLRDIDDAIEKEISSDCKIDSTIKKRLIEGRVGQDFFKKSIYEFEKSCRLKRIETPCLLIASHIKPWRLCTTAFERLDGANGLLLSPDVDALFDRGLISFRDDGSVLVSPRLNHTDLALLGLEKACGENVGSFHPRQKYYLSFHRDIVFLP